jgi:hypothetical protein
MKCVVVYQAYGRPEILQQSLFSVISLVKKHDGLRNVHKILIYTDKPRYFQDFLGQTSFIQYEPMDSNRLQNWLGPDCFVHRVKIEMIRNATSIFPDKNLVYLDGDTFFTEDPADIFSRIDARTSFMHEFENAIKLGKDPLSKKLTKFLNKQDFKVQGHTFRIPSGLMMWNAGLIGFSPEFSGELRDVLALADQAYASYPKHIMEQLAFCYYLSKKTKIQSAQDFVYHYWKQNLETALKEFDSIKWPEALSPKKTLFQKLSDKMFGDQPRN